jgi:putative ABC transport system substrate-binding protein
LQSHKLPAIDVAREFTLAGGLMSYGPDILDAWRFMGNYTGRILNGAKPADLPIIQAVKVEFVINLKTAKALNIEVPPSLLARADEVIE